MRKFYMLAAVLLFSKALWAQQDSTKTVLDEVIVSATRSTQEVMQTARSVEVIDRQTIDESAVNSVGELLARYGNMYIVGEGQVPGTNQSIFLRGTNSNQTNVLIDGVRLTDPSTPNSAPDLNEISLANVDHVEIIKGAHGSLYGTGSIGGVINIITKKGNDGWHGDVSAQLGAYSSGGFSNVESAFLNYGKSGFYANASFYHNATTGLSAAVDSIQSDVYKTTDSDNFKKIDYSGKLGYQKGDFNVFASYKKTNQTADIDDGAYADDDNYFVDFDRDLFQYGASYKNDVWHVKLKGGYTESVRLSKDDSSLIDNSGHYDQTFVRNKSYGYLWTNELETGFKVNGLRFLLGAGQYAEDMNVDNYLYSGAFGVFEQSVNYDTLDLTLTTNYLFSSAILNFSELAHLKGLQLAVSGRYNKVNSGFSVFTFEVSPSYHFNHSTLYASYAEGFNNPSLIQLYDPSGGFNFTTRGNPNLKAETSQSFEVGYKQLINKNMALTVAVYSNKIENAIEYVYLWQAGKAISALGYSDYLGDTYLNIAQQEVKGLEVGVEGKISKKITFKANFNYLKGSYSFSPDDLDLAYTGNNHVQLFSNGLFINDEKSSDRLVRRPSYQAFASLSYQPIAKLSLSGNVRLVDTRPDSFYDPTLGPNGALNAQEVDRYALLGFNANYHWSHLFATLRMENLTNANYQEINGFNTRGRSLYLKLGYNF